MSKQYDVIVIGAGILGCFAARHLAAYPLKTAVLEQREDVCTGITRANSGIIYEGYDQHLGSLKAKLCVKANRYFEQLCEELDVPYRKTGLMMLSFGPKADAVLEKKLEKGKQLGLDQLRILTGPEVYEREPGLADGVSKALFSDHIFVADPWKLGIAAFENASANGVEFRFGEKAETIRRLKEGAGFEICTGKEVYTAKRLLCCAGLHSDAVWNMVEEPVVKIVPQYADYIVFDTTEGRHLSHIISVEPEQYGEGMTILPTADGNLLLGPTRRDAETAFAKDSSNLYLATEETGLRELERKCKALLPAVSFDAVIRSFGAVRPNPYHLEKDGTLSKKSVNDFLILEKEGLFALIGVKTPGITCANELGRVITERLLKSFAEEIQKKTDFDPCRKGIRNTAASSTLPADSRIICRCRGITYGEIKEAIRRGAVTVDGVKRRTDAGMGRCQGGSCMEQVLRILAEETGTDIYMVTKDGPGSEILKCMTKEDGRGNL